MERGRGSRQTPLKSCDGESGSWGSWQGVGAEGVSSLLEGHSCRDPEAGSSLAGRSKGRTTGLLCLSSVSLWRCPLAASACVSCLSVPLTGLPWPACGGTPLPLQKGSDWPRAEVRAGTLLPAQSGRAAPEGLRVLPSLSPVNVQPMSRSCPVWLLVERREPQPPQVLGKWDQVSGGGFTAESPRIRGPWSRADTRLLSRGQTARLQSTPGAPEHLLKE